jgi:hypothetical protein
MNEPCYDGHGLEALAKLEPRLRDRFAGLAPQQSAFSLDAIVLSKVLEHIGGIAGALASVARGLRHGLKRLVSVAGLAAVSRSTMSFLGVATWFLARRFGKSVALAASTSPATRN